MGTEPMLFWCEYVTQLVWQITPDHQTVKGQNLKQILLACRFILRPHNSQYNDKDQYRNGHHASKTTSHQSRDQQKF